MNNSQADADVSDLELVSRSQSGDRDAFGSLVKRHQTAACSVAYAICGDFSASEDVAQEAFVVAWKQLRHIQKIDRFRAWVCGVARNIALSRVRKRVRREDFLPEKQIQEPVDTAASPVEKTIDAEESNITWQTLYDLPQTYREPLVLFYREQHSVAAVAGALDLSEDAVKKRLSRGRALLRREIAKRIETTLERTRPGTVFTTTVLGAIPSLAAGVAAVSTTVSAKAASVAGSSSGGSVAGAVAGVATSSLFASGGVSILGLYTLFRCIRSPNQPIELKRIIIKTAAICFAPSMLFGACVYWIASTKGTTLEKWGISSEIAVAVALVLLLVSVAFFSLRASRLVRRLQIDNRAAASKSYRYISKLHLGRVPLVSIAFGPNLQNGESYGLAKAWIAIGDVALGGIAIGLLAAGPVSFSAVGVGITAFGGITFGFLSCGCVSVGYAAIGCLAMGWEVAVGVVSIAKELAIGSFSLASNQAIGAVAIANQVNDSTRFLQSQSEWSALAQELLPHTAWLVLLCLPAILVALHYIQRNERAE